MLLGHHPISERQEQCIPVSSVPGRRHLRSVDQLLLSVPRCHGAIAQNVVSQWLAHRRGIVCLRCCVRLLFNFHKEISKIYKTQLLVSSITSSRLSKHGSSVIMPNMDSLPSKNIKIDINSNFCDDRIRKTGQVIFSKCDLDLTFIYEVIQRGSPNILLRLYVKFIWL